MNNELHDGKNYLDGQVRGVAENVDETRTVTFQISDGSKDRHGTRLNMENWNIDDFNRNPVIGYNHDVYGGTMCMKGDPDDIIGSGRAYFETKSDGEKVLLCDVTFEPAEVNELAEKVFQKVKLGTIRATSVGFMPIKNSEGKSGMYGYRDEDGMLHDADTYYYYGQELIELSVVNIPSNRNALKRDVRDTAANALHFVRDQLGVTTPELLTMSVAEVLGRLEKPEPRNTEVEEIEEEQLPIEENDSEESEQALATKGQRLRERKLKYLKIKRENIQ